MTLIDLDNVLGWPKDLLEFLQARKKDLLIERETMRKYDLTGSDYRMFNPPPKTPAHDAIIRFIGTESSSWLLRVFHATRLVSFNQVRQEGLRMMNVAERIQFVQNELEKAGSCSPNLISSLSEQSMDSNFYENREGRVFFTPLRRYLHDSGCEVFFEHLGGEAIQRIALVAGDPILRAIQSIGQPAVVVARIPATGWCEFADSRFPPTVIDLFLESEGTSEATIAGWDVMIKRDIPAAHIEMVVAPTHSSITA